MLIEVGYVREHPAQDGAVCTDADDVTLIWTDLHASDRSAVSKSDVRHRSLLVEPNLLNTRRHTSILQWHYVDLVHFSTDASHVSTAMLP